MFQFPSVFFFQNSFWQYLNMIRTLVYLTLESQLVFFKSSLGLQLIIYMTCYNYDNSSSQWTCDAGEWKCGPVLMQLMQSSKNVIYSGYQESIYKLPSKEGLSLKIVLSWMSYLLYWLSINKCEYSQPWIILLGLLDGELWRSRVEALFSRMSIWLLCWVDIAQLDQYWCLKWK